MIDFRIKIFMKIYFKLPNVFLFHVALFGHTWLAEINIILIFGTNSFTYISNFFLDVLSPLPPV